MLARSDQLRVRLLRVGEVLLGGGKVGLRGDEVLLRGVEVLLERLDPGVELPTGDVEIERGLLGEGKSDARSAKCGDLLLLPRAGRTCFVRSLSFCC